MKLQNKTAVVTGGTSGLGAAVAHALLQRGTRVAVLALDTARRPAFLDEFGAAVMLIDTDVSDAAAGAAAMKQVAEVFGSVDICVNCAGGGQLTPLLSPDDDAVVRAFQQVVATNLFGTFNISRLCARIMAAGAADEETGERGVIVNTGAGAAWDGQKGMAGYGGAKAAVASMTMPMVRELSEAGIRVCTVAPGLFQTGLTERVPPERLALLESYNEFPRRAGRPEEFAALVLHIIENTYLNGEVIRLDAASRPPGR